MSFPSSCKDYCGQNHFQSIENTIAVVKWFSMADSKENTFDNTLCNEDRNYINDEVFKKNHLRFI